MENKKGRLKKVILSVVILLIIFRIIFCIYDSLPKYKTSNLVDKNSYYHGDATGNFFEITQNGNVYSHNFNKKPEKVEENSDIIYILLIINVLVMAHTIYVDR